MADHINLNEVAHFDATKNKKKKKFVLQDSTDDSVDNLAEITNKLAVSDGQESKVPRTRTGEDEKGEGTVLEAPSYLWEKSNRDYTHEELLDRVFNILRENNPELAGDRRRTVMRPPQVLREGTKKTVFVNFMDLCKAMHRQPNHVMDFLLAELGTDGSLDGQQRLVVKGRFAPKSFEGLLRRYGNDYVICNGCKSPDTILSKENRLIFLRCEKCGSGRTVTPINRGYLARVGRRNTGA